MTEFELIRRLFSRQSIARPDVRVPIGDDAAIVRVPPGRELVVTTDVSVAGVHFYADADPCAIGHKTLAVNLSDLAAMGAAPAWFLLDLTLPSSDVDWLEKFSEGMFRLAERHGVQLVGGDTSRGPLSITITAMGTVPEGQGLLRSGARVGDIVAVTGTLGDAALALALTKGRHTIDAHDKALLQRLEYPTPRIGEGQRLRAVASSAIDVSDGLVADLGHVLEASGVGARVQLESLPLSPIYRAHLSTVGWDYAVAGGDDYELCVTLPPANLPALKDIALECGVAITPIGEIVAGDALELLDSTGHTYRTEARGYNHFKDA